MSSILSETQRVAWTLDTRISVLVTEDAAALAAALATGPKAAVLAVAPAPALPEGAVTLGSFDALQSHAVACSCCGGGPPPAGGLGPRVPGRGGGPGAPACPGGGGG